MTNSQRRRTNRTRAELDALEPKVLGMLLDGATTRAIYLETRYSLNDIARLRREAGLPVPRRDSQAGQRRTVDQAFARYARLSEDGHLLWTGPRSGRSLDLLASGRRHNAVAVAFRKHHGRAHEGNLRRTCSNPDCIAAEHHTDRRIRAESKDTARA